MATKGMAEFRADGENYTINDPNNAEEFNPNKPYQAGEFVYYQGNLQMFTAPHAAGAWIGTDAIQTKLGDQVTNLKSALGVVAEGCKIISSSDMIQGSYDSTHLWEPLASTTSIRNQVPIRVMKGTKIEVKQGATHCKYAGLGWFSLNGAYINEINWTTDTITKTFEDDYYIVIVFKDGSGTTLTANNYDAITTIWYTSEGEKVYVFWKPEKAVAIKKFEQGAV